MKLCPTIFYNQPMERKIIKNEKFYRIATNIKPDTKRRIVLARECLTEDVTYHVYCNEVGQIVLDPQVSIPASEAWLFKNPEAREAVIAGLREAAEGTITKVNLEDL